MERYYKERFETQKMMLQKMASILEVNDLLERFRAEIRSIIPTAMESCILLMDPDAYKYTRPLQCALYDRPVNCLSCKRNRAAIQKAVARRKAIVVKKSNPIIRSDGTMIQVGPEMAVPVYVEEKLVAVLSVIARPGAAFTKKDFFLLKDLADNVGFVIIRSKKHWDVTQEKIRISRVLSRLSPFVPLTVRNIVQKNPESADSAKEKKEVTVLFLDLEDYTKMSENMPDTAVNEMIESLFSSFVDPIHRSSGDIVETAGDGLMIVFQDHDAKTNAVNAVRAAFDIWDLSTKRTSGFAGIDAGIKINIGINSGTALVGMTKFQGTLGSRMTYTASGPVTNVAARLAAYAKGGDILVGQSTRSYIDGLWPVFDLGDVTLKGIETPVRIFSLIGN